MNHFPKTALIVIGVASLGIILSAAFYWFEWRPAAIRSGCAEKVYYSTIPNSDEAVAILYQHCLHLAGLE